MNGKKKEGYDRTRLEGLGKALENLKRPKKGVFGVPALHVNIDGLQKAVEALPKDEKKIIENFWGLKKESINHSENSETFSLKNLAYINMRNTAYKTLRQLLQLDYMVMYNSYLCLLIEQIVKKINNNVEGASDLDCVKYLMAFSIFLRNGPKMDYEVDPLTVDTDCNENNAYDEYIMIDELRFASRGLPDHSINLRLLVDFLEMLDLKDLIAIKHSVGLELKDSIYIENGSRIPMPKKLKKEWPVEDIEVLKTISQLRHFKERIFPCGAWEVTNQLVTGNARHKINLDAFIKELDVICKDWSRISEYQVGQKALRTSKELRQFPVYRIGGLEFTDRYEVQFLYLEGHLLSKHYA